MKKTSEKQKASRRAAKILQSVDEQQLAQVGGGLIGIGPGGPGLCQMCGLVQSPPPGFGF